jgi:hypothetical protein
MFDLNETLHVHVRNVGREAKYWVQPLVLSWSHGYRPHELSEIERLIEERRSLILALWQEELNKR